MLEMHPECCIPTMCLSFTSCCENNGLAFAASLFDVWFASMRSSPPPPPPLPPLPSPFPPPSVTFLPC